MSTKWFCKIGDRQYGPLTAGQLRRMAERGQVNASSLLRREDATDWVSATMVKGLLAENGEAPLTDAQKSVPVARAVSQSSAEQDAMSSSAKQSPKAPPRSPKPPSKVATPVVSSSASSTPRIDVASDDQKLGRRRNKNGLIVITVGAFVCGLVVVASAGYLAFHLSRSSDTQPDKVAATSVETSDTQTGTNDSSSNEQDSTNDSRAKEPTDLSVKQMMSAVKKWRDLSKFRGAGTKTVVVEIASVRLGFDASAISVSRNRQDKDDPVLDLKALGVNSTERRSPTERKYNDPEAESETKTKSNFVQQPRFIFVSLSVSNRLVEESVIYKTWNGSAPPKHATSAVLVDDRGNECPLVPRSEMAADKRLGSDTLVPGNGKVADLLAFRAPKGEFKYLRLVLPYEAVGQSGVYFGFQIPKEVIVDSTQSTPQKVANGPKARAAKPSIDEVTRGIDELDGKAKDEKKPEPDLKPPVKKLEKRPPSIDELNRQFEELEKKKKAEANQKQDE